jgi:hypothetical protein
VLVPLPLVVPLLSLEPGEVPLEPMLPLGIEGLAAAFGLVAELFELLEDLVDWESFHRFRFDFEVCNHIAVIIPASCDRPLRGMNMLLDVVRIIVIIAG